MILESKASTLGVTIKVFNALIKRSVKFYLQNLGEMPKFGGDESAALGEFYDFYNNSVFLCIIKLKFMF